MKSGLGRRDFLKLLGVTAAAPAAGCASSPVETIIPYVVPPEDVVPGVATHYATVCRECPAGCGLIARVREGRAVKVEGNPAHPVNRGALCARGQASLQGLYDPDRIRQPLLRDAGGTLRPASWDEAETLLAEKLAAARAEGRAEKVALVTHLVTGSLGRLLDDWLGALGFRRRVAHEPFAHEALRQANAIAFGRAEIPLYRIDEARLLVGFGADFLETWLSPVAYARAFGEMHAVSGGRLGSFVQVEPRLSLTGANADEWVRIRPGAEAFLALGMARVILQEFGTPALDRDEREKLALLLEPYTPEAVALRTDVPAATIARLGRAFGRSSPSLAIAGGAAVTSREATVTLVAVNLLNYVAGNVNRTIRFGATESVARASSYAELLSLASEMSRGEVPVLLVYGANPLFTLPPAAGFAEALARVPFVASFSSFLDETTERAHLVLPDSTPLESWGDYTPRDGIHGLVQPVMRPLFDTRSVGDVLLSVAKRVMPEETNRFAPPSFYDYLRDSWQKEVHERVAPGTDFDAFWREALERGGVFEEVPPAPVRLSEEALSVAFAEPRFDGGERESFHLVVYPSSRYFDGRSANRPWLQELPDPLTEVVWDSWVEIHPEAARQLGVAHGDLVALRSPHGEIELPAYVYDGIRPDAVAVPFGEGHTAYGRTAAGVGVSPVRLLAAAPEERSGTFPWLSTRVEVRRTGKRGLLVTTDGSRRQLGRDVTRAVSLTELGRKDGEPRREPLPEMYPEVERGEYRWGMAIDLSSCVGCGACVTACYAENNVPVVGKEMVAMGREMSWIRIERYFEGEASRPEVRFLPMLCQQCGNAPCEPVCPVYATYHNSEGLNGMVYNRCIGTRYCSNNCPYKVRRFNWKTLSRPAPSHLQLNPDVAVREMGVMEKCTFCIQRIVEAKDRARDEGRAVRDGEIVPACAQTCPTQAIVFGNLVDPESRVSRMTRDERAYGVLGDLNTKPAIAYLKKVVRPRRGVAMLPEKN